MKKIGIAFCLAVFTLGATAQISERENDATMVKLGARPVKGDAALTFSANFGKFIEGGGDAFEQGDATLYTGNFFAKGDFLTFKYFLSDDMAIRIAGRLSKSSFKFKGERADSDSVYYPVGDGYEQLIEQRSNVRDYSFVPGIEKHFNASNIFDVYAGVDLFVGLRKEDTLIYKEAKNGDKDNFEWKRNSTFFGLGTVIGFNMFVAHLPISVGLEYGLNLKWIKGGVYKVEADKKAGTMSGDYEYVTINKPTYPLSDAPFVNTDEKWEKLKKSAFEMDSNQDVRLIINIYFGL